MTAKFVGLDQITYKNDKESSRTHVNQILLSRNRPKHALFAHTVSDGIKSL